MDQSPYYFYKDSPKDRTPPTVGDVAQLALADVFAKTSSPDKPFLVPNEYICNRLAQLLHLPVPVGLCINYTPDSNIHKTPSIYFASHRLYLEARPRLIEDLINELLKEKPELLTGILIFDIWICNQDRHTSNIIHDIFDTNQLFIIDHGDALLAGRSVDEAAQHIQTTTVHKCLQNHRFAELASNTQRVSDWISRVHSIPEQTIRQICKEVIGCGYQGAFSEDDATKCADILLCRRDELHTIHGEEEVYR